LEEVEIVDEEKLLGVFSEIAEKLAGIEYQLEQINEKMAIFYRCIDTRGQNPKLRVKIG